LWASDNFKNLNRYKITNILTIDVEDWYMDTDISTLDSYEDRVVESTQKILKILDETIKRYT